MLRRSKYFQPGPKDIRLQIAVILRVNKGLCTQSWNGYTSLYFVTQHNTKSEILDLSYETLKDPVALYIGVHDCSVCRGGACHLNLDWLILPGALLKILLQTSW